MNLLFIHKLYNFSMVVKISVILITLQNIKKMLYYLTIDHKKFTLFSTRESPDEFSPICTSFH